MTRNVIPIIAAPWALTFLRKCVDEMEGQAVVLQEIVEQNQLPVQIDQICHQTLQEINHLEQTLTQMEELMQEQGL